MVSVLSTYNGNNNNLHLYSANLYMNIFGCTLQYCYIKFLLKVTHGSYRIFSEKIKDFSRTKIIFPKDFFSKIIWSKDL